MVVPSIAFGSLGLTALRIFRTQHKQWDWRSHLDRDMPSDAFMGKIVHNNAIWIHIGEINVRQRLGLNLRKAYRAKYGSLLDITAAWYPSSKVGKTRHGMIQAADTSRIQGTSPSQS